MNGRSSGRGCSGTPATCSDLCSRLGACTEQGRRDLARGVAAGADEGPQRADLRVGDTDAGAATALPPGLTRAQFLADVLDAMGDHDVLALGPAGSPPLVYRADLIAALADEMEP